MKRTFAAWLTRAENSKLVEWAKEYPYQAAFMGVVIVIVVVSLVRAIWAG